MPYRPNKPCSWPYCPELVSASYCATHLVEYNKLTHTEDDAEFYKSDFWRKLSKQVLARDPLCVDCLKKNRVASSCHADHIIPRTSGGPDTMDNLQGLCRSCHSRKTLQQNRIDTTSGIRGKGVQISGTRAARGTPREVHEISRNSL